MTKIFDTPTYGEVKVCNAMLDIDGTNLDDGIEINADGQLIEIQGWRDLDNMTSKDVDELITNHL